MWPQFATDFMPRPTRLREDVPATITASPSVRRELVRRALATCGYIRGDSAQPLTCPTGYNCIETIKTEAIFACCNDIECLDDYGLCMDFGQPGCAGYDLDAQQCSSIFGNILRCPVSSPDCMMYKRSSTLGDQMTYVSYGCATTSLDVMVLATPTNGVNANEENTQASSAAKTALFPGITTSLARSPLSSSGVTDPVSSTVPTTRQSSGLSTTAIIVISVCIGLVVLSSIVIMGCFCCIRHRRRHERIVNKPPSPVNLPPEPTVISGPGSIYSWSAGVRPGAPPPPSHYGSTLSGPTATSYH